MELREEARRAGKIKALSFTRRVQVGCLACYG